MGVHMIAWVDGLTCKANDLVITPNWLANCKKACCHFVSRGDEAFDGRVFDAGAPDELRASDNDVIMRVKADKILHFKYYLQNKFFNKSLDKNLTTLLY